MSSCSRYDTHFAIIISSHSLMSPYLHCRAHSYPPCPTAYSRSVFRPQVDYANIRLTAVTTKNASPSLISRQKRPTCLQVHGIGFLIYVILGSVQQSGDGVTSPMQTGSCRRAGRSIVVIDVIPNPPAPSLLPTYFSLTLPHVSRFALHSIFRLLSY